jgi:hypothetical protein
MTWSTMSATAVLICLLLSACVRTGKVDTTPDVESSTPPASVEQPSPVEPVQPTDTSDVQPEIVTVEATAHVGVEDAPQVAHGLGSGSEHGLHVLGTRAGPTRMSKIRRGLVEPTEAERQAIAAEDAMRWNMAAIGEPKVDGDLDTQAVFEVIAADHDGLRYCYQKQHNIDPTLGGDVVVTIDVDPDGAVGTVAIEPLLEGGEDLQHCVRGRIMRLRFAASGVSNRIEVPLSFQAP